MPTVKTGISVRVKVTAELEIDVGTYDANRMSAQDLPSFMQSMRDNAKRSLEFKLEGQRIIEIRGGSVQLTETTYVPSEDDS